MRRTLIALTALTLLFPGPGLADPNTSAEKAAHLLNRLTFGPRPGDIEAVEAMGIDKFIDQQLNPASINENPDVQRFIASAPALTSTPQQLFMRFGPPAIKAASGGLGNRAGKLAQNQNLAQAQNLAQSQSQGENLNQDQSQSQGDDPARRFRRFRIKRQGAALEETPDKMYAANQRGAGGHETAQNPDQMEAPGSAQNINGDRAPSGVKQGKAALDQNIQGKEKEKKLKGQFFHQIYDEVAQAKLMRAVESPRQLEEVMTDFWFNHFNIFANKGLDHLWIGAYEEQAIRPYALGKFRDLLGATCHHAGMLFYLDNWQNSAPGTRRGKKEIGLNENYARELMELHTLGVDGGYSQQDVIQLAHVLTGLGLPPLRQLGRRLNGGEAINASPMGCFFDARRHDPGDKVLLGQTIKGAGEAEIEQALDILARSPATAHHISYQLAQYFVCDDPPKSLVDKLSGTFTRTDGDIKAVLSTLFHSSEFWDPKYAEAKYKSPFRFVVSSLRAVDAQPTNYKPLEQYLKQQGQPLYGCLTPDGYKNTKEAWLNPGALLRRIDFATMLASGRFHGIKPQLTDCEKVADTTGDVFSERTTAAIKNAPEQLKTALVLGSPEFMLY